MLVPAIGKRVVGAVGLVPARGSSSVTPLPDASLLAAYYTFDDVDVVAGVAKNRAASGSTFDAALFNTPASVVGSVPGQARSFDAGSSQYIEYPLFASHPPTPFPPWQLNVWSGSPEALPWTVVSQRKWPDLGANQGTIFYSGDQGDISGHLTRMIFFYNDGSATPKLYIRYFRFGTLAGDNIFEGPAGFDYTPYHTVVITGPGTANGAGRIDPCSAFIDGVEWARITDTVGTGLTEGSSGTRAWGARLTIGGQFYTQTVDEEAWYWTQVSAAQTATFHSLRVQGIRLRDYYGI